MTPVEHALAYAELGWRVAPIAPGTKFPRVDAWQKVATTNELQIRQWWKMWPDSGVSIVTGVESGLVVIDIDPRHDGDVGWAELETKHGTVDTVEALTGGGGRHLLFAMPADVVITNAADSHLPAGIDVRGEGGQIVAAPSIHPVTGQPYVWEVEHDPLDGHPVAPLPAWLLELLTRPALDQKPRATERSTYVGESIVERFAANHTWPELLQADGWTYHSTRNSEAHGICEHWTRPGKTTREGSSASLYAHGEDSLVVFTSAVPGLTKETAYTKFGYYAATRHQGDHSEAATIYRRLITPLDGVVGVGGTEAKNGAAPAPPVIPPPAPPATPKPERHRPPVFVNSRDLAEVVEEITNNLEGANDPPELFVRNGKPVRVRSDENERPMIETLSQPTLALHAAEAMRFVRARKPTKDDANPAPARCSPPPDIITGVLSRRSWPFPGLVGITETPVLRPDGTFHTAHGFDAATGLYHWAPGRASITIALAPSAAELAAAVALIDDMLCDFPWSTTADRANAWALMLTPIVRPIIGLAPLALLDAPQPGSGKTILATITTIVATGRPAAMQPFSTNDEELEKRITTMMLAGVTTIAFDNVDGTIRSPILASALTVNTWQGRTLGRNELVEVPNRVTWLATGNNIDVGGDMARRCYRIRLEPHGAALGRTYKHTPLEPWVTEHRNELVAALCTIVRSWWVAGRHAAPDGAKFDSYDSWAANIGGILHHAGVVGFLANADDFRRHNDREAAGWESFLGTWMAQYGPDRELTVKTLVSFMSSTDSEIRGALPDDLAEHWDTKGFSVRLGKALAKRSGRLYGETGLRIVQLPPNHRKVVEFIVADNTATRSTLDFEANHRVSPRDENAPTSKDATDAGIRGDYSGLSGQENCLEDGQPQRPDQTPRIPASETDTLVSTDFDTRGYIHGQDEEF